MRFVLALAITVSLFAQRPSSQRQQPDSDPPAASQPAAPAKPAVPEPPPVVTEKELKLNGRTLKYKAAAGRLPLVNEKTGQTEAHVFFMAYTLDTPTPKAQRPLMFSFNGGPGAASVWMHLGLIGPKRVKLNEDGSYPQPPFKLVDNDQTFLDFADLVFIDTVGTGYSRAATQELGKKFFGVDGDIESVGEFIRLYLTKYNRWTSPLFVIGESYGTFRAAGVAGYLVGKGVAFNGVLLVSSILNFQTTSTLPGNDLPYLSLLPSMTATSWYHKKLPAELQGDFKKAVREAESYATSEYPSILFKGDRLTAAERASAVAKLARLTGLDKGYIDRANLRVTLFGYAKELLRTEGKIVGRLDSRLTAVVGSDNGDSMDFDPLITAIVPPYRAMVADYLANELGYKSDLDYYVLGGGIGPWDYGREGRSGRQTQGALRQAFLMNPHMRLFVASGYYDFGTPYFGTEFTLSHLGLPASYKKQMVTRLYDAGHMMYIHTGELSKVATDVREFVKASVPAAQ
jgi:carboxypeptidase C (cathepsin A)